MQLRLQLQVGGQLALSERPRQCRATERCLDPTLQPGLTACSARLSANLAVPPPAPSLQMVVQLFLLTWERHTMKMVRCALANGLIGIGGDLNLAFLVMMQQAAAALVSCKNVLAAARHVNAITKGAVAAGSLDRT